MKNQNCSTVFPFFGRRKCSAHNAAKTEVLAETRKELPANRDVDVDTKYNFHSRLIDIDKVFAN